MKMLPILLFLLFPLVLSGQEKNIDENLLAVARYDLVSYFLLTTHSKGEDFAVIRKVARYLFASKKIKRSLRKIQIIIYPPVEAGSLCND